MSESTLSRRALLGMTATAAFAAFAKAHGMNDQPQPVLDKTFMEYMNDKSAAIKQFSEYQMDNDQQDIIPYPNVHEGDGTIGVKLFRFDGGPKPSLLIIYDIPPGASEGVHTHNLEDKKEGSFDEFYYIVSGEGEMDIADEAVQVKPGDHVFTPNSVPQGIRNTSTSENLKVFLTAIIR